MNSPTGPFEKGCSLDRGAGACELDINLEILRGVPVFSGIPLQRLKLYAYLSKRARYREGEFLFHQGETDDRGYIVISGRIQVIREHKDHSILLNEFQEGEFFGGLALLSDITRLFSVRAATQVECLTLDRESFQKLLIQFPELAVRVLEIMIKRVVQMEEKLLQAQEQDCVMG